MPTAVIDLKTAEDPRDVVHRTVQALAEGKLVVFPTETLYGVVASALNAQSVKRLRSLCEDSGRFSGMELVVKSSDDALDYVPEMNDLGRRLCRRCWPGPLTFRMNVGHPESVFRRIPLEVRDVLAPRGVVGLRVPFHEVILSVLRLTIGPLVISDILPQGQSGGVCGDEVADGLEGSVDLVLNSGRSKYGQPATVVDVYDQGWTISRPGVVSEQALQRLSSMMILLVCTGNTCRSPMAEVLLKKQIADRLGCSIDEIDQHGVVVASAGVAAMAGGRPSSEAVQVMNERGLDLSQHFSQPFSDQLARQADLILTMTQGHRLAILSQWPDLASRTFVVRRDQGDISDPIGGPHSIYEKCANQINEQLSPWVQELDLKKSSEK
jgi:tRNA threonylcarbamoyl adenosine modification protein (Sua5/YciO/YrdC/YwlC family)